jgi:hypothetical protein
MPAQFKKALETEGFSHSRGGRAVFFPEKQFRQL